MPKSFRVQALPLVKREHKQASRNDVRDIPVQTQGRLCQSHTDSQVDEDSNGMINSGSIDI